MAEELVVEYQLSRDRILHGRMNEPVTARLRIETSDAFARQYPKTYCDVILVVDTSGSMDEPFAAGQALTKREGVIKAAEDMLKALQPEDTVSLVCFDSQAYEELRGVRASDRAAIQAALQKVREHTGSTNFEAAFTAAQGLLSRLKQPSRRLVFLTDGNANTGSMQQANDSNKAIAALGVTVDCFGVGEDYNHQLMCDFVKESNGEAQKLDTPQQAAALFKGSLKNAQQALIRNAVLRLMVPQDLRDVEFYQATPQQHDHSTPEGIVNKMLVYRVLLSSLTQIHIYNFVLRVSMDTPPAGDGASLLLGKVVLEYDVPVKHARSVKAECNMFMSFSSQPGEEVRRTEVDEIYLTATLERLEKRVQDAGQKSDWREVSALLQQMCERAKEIGRRDLLADYQKRLDLLVKNGHLTQGELNENCKTTSKAQSQMGVKQASPDLLGGGF